MNDEHAPQPPRDPSAVTPDAPYGTTPSYGSPASYDGTSPYAAPSGAGSAYAADAAYGSDPSYGPAPVHGAPWAETTEQLPATASPFDHALHGAAAAGSGAPAPVAAGAAGTAAPRRGPGWGGTSALVLAGMLLSSGLTLGGVGAYDQLQGDEPVATAQNSQTSEARPAATTTSEDPDWAAISEQVSPSAVSILSSTGSGTSQGTGVVLDEDGTILTNDHVAGDAESLQVTTSDGRSFAASIVGTDPSTDLAVIRLEDPPEDLQPATFADSSTVVVGQPVMALGPPPGPTAPTPRSPPRSRPTPRSTPATPADRSWTPRGRSSASTPRSPRSPTSPGRPAASGPASRSPRTRRC